MAFSDQQLKSIYQRTTGYCHICHKKLALANYGVIGAKGAWEVEHSNPRINGGTNRLNNLYPACISCNRSKGASSTKSARARNNKTRAPLSADKRKDAKIGNAILGGVAGLAVGAIFGPLAGLAGTIFGASQGYKRNPDR